MKSRAGKCPSWDLDPGAPDSQVLNLSQHALGEEESIPSYKLGLKPFTL